MDCANCDRTFVAIDSEEICLLCRENAVENQGPDPMLLEVQEEARKCKLL